VIDVALKLLYHLPLLVLCAAAATVVAERRRAPGAGATRRMVLVLLAAAFLAAFNRPHDWVHLLVLYPPTLLLLGAMAALLGRRAPRLGRVVQGGAWVALGAAVFVSGALAIEFARHHATPIRSRRGALYGTPAQARALEPRLDALAAAPPPAGGTPVPSAAQLPRRARSRRDTRSSGPSIRGATATRR
jgi:hypothetical protein